VPELILSEWYGVPSWDTQKLQKHTRELAKPAWKEEISKVAKRSTAVQEKTSKPLDFYGQMIYIMVVPIRRTP
jgi:hypothetical protein